MFDLSVTLGNALAAVGVLATWYFNVKRFRREDKTRRDSQHDENQRRLASIERHLGGPNDPPLAQRVGVIEIKVAHLERQICKP